MKNLLRARATLPGRFQAKAKNDVGELYIYDFIGASMWGGISAKDVADALATLKGEGAKSLNVYINSEGGDVFDGVAIHNVIKRFDGQKTVYIDGIAASIASIIAMSGDKIVTAANAMWMIHDPWTIALGNAREFRKLADDLDKVKGTLIDTYATRTKLKAADVEKLMAEETWMDAAMAKEKGFTDEVTDEEGQLEDASVRPFLAQYRNTPEKLKVRETKNAAVMLAKMATHASSQRRASPAPQPGQPGRK